MRILVLAAVIVAFMISAVPVKAEETVFDKASSWINSWKAPCAMTATCGKAAPAKEGKAMKVAPMSKCHKTDALGNKIPTKTVK